MDTIQINGRTFKMDEVGAITRAIEGMEDELKANIARADAAEESVKALTADRDEQGTKVITLTTERDAEKTRADEAEAKVKELEDNRLDSGELNKIVAERLELVQLAAKVDADIADEDDNAAIMKKIALTKFDEDDLPSEAIIAFAVKGIRKDADKAPAKTSGGKGGKKTTDGESQTKSLLKGLMNSGAKKTADGADDDEGEGDGDDGDWLSAAQNKRRDSMKNMQVKRAN